MELMLGERLRDKHVLKTEKAREFFQGMVEEGVVLDHCLAGLVNESKLWTGRTEGSVAWQGATKCFWVCWTRFRFHTYIPLNKVVRNRVKRHADEMNQWIDRAAGICGFYGSQTIGPHDKGMSAKMNEKFEKAVYDELGCSG